MEFAWQLIIKAGLAAALIKSLWGIIANYFTLTKFDLSLYLGCLITGKTSKNTVMLVGLCIQVVLGILLAFIYSYLLALLNWQPDSLHVLIFALGQWLIAGGLLPLADSGNSCVHNNMLPSMGAYASHYGYRGMLVYCIGHLLFGLTIGYMLQR